MQNLELIAQLMIDNHIDFLPCIFNSESGKVTKGSLCEFSLMLALFEGDNNTLEVWLADDNDTCNMNEWIKLKKII